MKIDEETDERSRRKWVILLVSLFAFVSFAFSFQAAPPLIQSIKSEFSIASDAQVALVMSIALIPGIFLSLPAGILAGRYGTFRVGFLSLLCVIAGSLVSAVASSFSVLLMGRLILGVGGALIFTAAPALITEWFTRDELGKAMGLFGLNMPLATAIAFPTSSLLLNAYGWRLPFTIGFVISITAMVLFIGLARGGPLSRRSKISNIRQAVWNFEIWKLGLVWLLFQAAALSFTTWAPTLFERFQSIQKVEASVYASLLSWVAIFCVPLMGYMSDRTGRRKAFAVMGLVLMTLALLALAFSSGLMLVCFAVALGIVTAMVPPIASSLPPEILGQSFAGVGFGITTMCGEIGAALAQPGIGSILDSTQSYTLSLFGMALASAAGAIVAYTLKTR